MTTPDPAELSERAASGPVRKTAIAVAGTAVTAAGVVMLVTPGPGIVGILAGLGILSSEFPAARRTLNKLLRKGADPTP